MKRTEIWGTDTCSYCKLARELLDNHGVEYTFFNARELSVKFKTLFPEATTVPQIIFQGEHVGGYSDLAEEMNNRNMFIGSQSIT